MENNMVTFLINCLTVGLGLLCLGGTVLAILTLKWKTLPLLLFSIAGLVQVFYWFAPSGFAENAFLQNNHLTLIGLIAMIIVERKKMAEGFRQIAQWFKAKFTHETIR